MPSSQEITYHFNFLPHFHLVISSLIVFMRNYSACWAIAVVAVIFEAKLQKPSAPLCFKYYCGISPKNKAGIYNILKVALNK
jgi:hypothetical protein